MRRPRATILALLLLALATSVRAADSEPIDLPEGQPWTHEPSQFVFPPDVGTFTRVSAFRYDDEGRNVSVGFSDRALKVLVTAYVYPNAGQPLAAHFEQVKRDVKQVHPAAKLLGEGVWKLEQGGRKLTGRRAAFAFRVTVGGQEHDVVSEAFLLRQGDHFIKFRVTCPEERFEAASDRIGRFLQSLKIPQPVASAASEK
jgi:hypothetical protein